jgi:hypothetical protein
MQFSIEIKFEYNKSKYINFFHNISFIYTFFSFPLYDMIKTSPTKINIKQIIRISPYIGIANAQ